MQAPLGPDLSDQATAQVQRPARMHHHAFVSTDLERTRHFYEDIIGLPLTATWAEMDRFPGRDRIYCHTLFELADGSGLAFFQFQDPETEPPVVRQPSPSIHIALMCDEPTQQDILDRLRAAGFSEKEAYVQDHGYCQSLYVYDPDGLRLEFTVDRADMPEILARQRTSAHETLRRWLAGDHASNNEYRPDR
jgi:glyoxylase I family protein